MINKTYTPRRSRTWLLTLVAAVMLCFAAKTAAQNKVSIADFTIKPNEEKVVAVSLDNADPMSALEMTISLPEGLEYVEGSVARNEERVSRETHMIYMTADGYNQHKLVILPTSRTDMAGNSGEVAYFTVKAGDAFRTGGNISVTDILGSSSHADETGATPSYEMPDFDVRATAYVGKMYATEDTLAIKTDGTYRKISFALDNFIEIRGLQADIKLPEGLAFETKADGTPSFEYGERIPQNMSIMTNTLEDGTLRMIITGLTAETFKGETGTVFSFNVKADEKLPLKSVVTLANVNVSSMGAVSYLVDDLKGIELTNSYIAHYTPAADSIQALQTVYADTLARIDEVAPDVKDSETLTAAKQAIEEMIASLQDAVDAAYDDYTLAPQYDEVLSPSADILAAIEKLMADAIAEQEEHDIQTGISEVDAAAGGDAIVAVYTLSGAQTAAPLKAGVYVVKYADGTVKKVLVK